MNSAIPFRAMIAGTLSALCMVTAARADIVISSAATSNVTCASGVCTPSAPDAVLNVGDLETMLASGNVKLAAAGEPVDVDVAASLSWVSTSTLTLDSYHSINVQQPVAITGGGGVSIITNDGSAGGQFAFMPGASVAFLNGAGSLAINGTGYTPVNDIATLVSDIAANPSGSYALAGNYNAAPDGTYIASPVSTNFYGNVQGLGNTISNLSITNGTRRTNLGLFASIESSSTISNLVLTNAEVSQRANGSGVGLLVGATSGTLFGDHTGGSVTGALGSDVGGLAGISYGTIANSSSSASVTASSTTIGGLVGSNLNGTINRCFAAGATQGIESKTYVGGLAGGDEGGVISNSYATGSTTGRAQVGGFIGGTEEFKISSSYSIGAVKGGAKSLLGGLVGVVGSGAFATSYWDKTTSGGKKAAGNAKKLYGVTGLKTEQLQANLPSGFDPSIWAESPSINNGFPYLIANPPQ